MLANFSATNRLDNRNAFHYPVNPSNLATRDQWWGITGNRVPTSFHTCVVYLWLWEILLFFWVRGLQGPQNGPYYHWFLSMLERQSERLIVHSHNAALAGQKFRTFCVMTFLWPSCGRGANFEHGVVWKYQFLSTTFKVYLSPQERLEKKIPFKCVKLLTKTVFSTFYFAFWTFRPPLYILNMLLKMPSNGPNFQNEKLKK